MKNIYRNTTLKFMILILTSSLLMISCEEEDPFVDRHASPVLIVFEGISGYLASGGLTSTPTRTYSVAAADYTTPSSWTISLYELDKSGILDNTVGIDSIPVPGVVVKLTKRDGTPISELTTDADGKVNAPLDWTQLVPGYDGMATGTSSTINVTWSGEFKGISFARYSVVVLKKI